VSKNCFASRFLGWKAIRGRVLVVSSCCRCGSYVAYTGGISGMSSSSNMGKKYAASLSRPLACLLVTVTANAWACWYLRACLAGSGILVGRAC
jgi:hypothetical protein